MDVNKFRYDCRLCLSTDKAGYTVTSVILKILFDKLILGLILFIIFIGLLFTDVENAIKAPSVIEFVTLWCALINAPNLLLLWPNCDERLSEF